MEKNTVTTSIKETAVYVRGLYKLKNAIKADAELFKRMSDFDGMEWRNYYVSCEYNCLYDYDLDEIPNYEDIKEDLETCRTAKYTLERYYGAEDDMLVTMDVTLGYVDSEIVVKELTVRKVCYVGCAMFLVD